MNYADTRRAWPPVGTLKGYRVCLRPFEFADLTPAYVGWLNDPEVVRYSNQRFREHDMKSCAAYLAAFEGTGNLFLAIVGVAEDRVIGTMTVYRSYHHSTADVGIMVGDRSTWGRGYGLEAWMLLIDWLLVVGGARKVTCGTLACNRSMRNVAEHSGMVLDGIRRAQEIVDGVPQDVVYYARFRSDL
jgi:ribosomal-protein-alanine N-acetyltransferase